MYSSENTRRWWRGSRENCDSLGCQSHSSFCLKFQGVKWSICINSMWNVKTWWNCMLVQNKTIPLQNSCWLSVRRYLPGLHEWVLISSPEHQTSQRRHPVVSHRLKQSSRIGNCCEDKTLPLASAYIKNCTKLSQESKSHPRIYMLPIKKNSKGLKEEWARENKKGIQPCHWISSGW